MYVISEPGYSATNWCRRIVSHLKDRARKKRVSLSFSEDPQPACDESCAFVLGGSALWIEETVAALQQSGCHPILLSELPDGGLVGRYSCVKTDYRRYLSLIAAQLAERGGERAAFYGRNRASLADAARTDAFLATFPGGEIFENSGSLTACFSRFLEAHRDCPFHAVVCANDLAAVSLLYHLKEEGIDSARLLITVHTGTALLSHFPDVRAVAVDHASLAAAAFEIADCVTAHPDFIGMRITVDYSTVGEGEGFLHLPLPTVRPADAPRAPDLFYEDAELDELLRIEQLLSSCDDTDLEILRLVSANRGDIGETTFLSDNGVKYRIKKMKRICNVPSRSDIPRLLLKYGICL